jgi:hypothetical protein
MKRRPRLLTEIEYRQLEILSRKKSPTVTISPSFLKLLLRWYNISHTAIEVLDRLKAEFEYWWE